MMVDPLSTQKKLKTKDGEFTYWSLQALEAQGLAPVERLPFTIRILLESVLRQVNGREITIDDVHALAAWKPGVSSLANIPFLPARVLMQDFTGVPAVVDLAAMRSALARMGGDPAKINPQVPGMLRSNFSAITNVTLSCDGGRKPLSNFVSYHLPPESFIK
jgi:aconitate hydratase